MSFFDQFLAPHLPSGLESIFKKKTVLYCMEKPTRFQLTKNGWSLIKKDFTTDLV